MSASFYDLLKYAKTGIASPEMTAYDKMRARSMAGVGAIKTLTGVPPLTFGANGKPLISWSMLGNGQQIGTPTPDAPIMPDFCGTLDGTDWKIPITCAGQTVPVYLGEVPTVRRIGKYVFTGMENIVRATSDTKTRMYYVISSAAPASPLYSSHFLQSSAMYGYPPIGECNFNNISNLIMGVDGSHFETAADFKSWLAAQYAAGTPVTVWYVLATPETATVNEPLCKIGNYSDKLSSTDAGVSIPTVKGGNTLTVDTDLQPSEMTITYKE